MSHEHLEGMSDREIERKGMGDPHSYYPKKKKEVAKKMAEHYKPENQRKIHYKVIKEVVKPRARGKEYEKVNRAFPTK